MCRIFFPVVLSCALLISPGCLCPKGKGKGVFVEDGYYILEETKPFVSFLDDTGNPVYKTNNPIYARQYAEERPDVELSQDVNLLIRYCGRDWLYNYDDKECSLRGLPFPELWGEPLCLPQDIAIYIPHLLFDFPDNPFGGALYSFTTFRVKALSVSSATITYRRLDVAFDKDKNVVFYILADKDYRVKVKRFKPGL